MYILLAHKRLRCLTNDTSQIKSYHSNVPHIIDEDSIRITGTAYVTSINTDTPSFMMHASQIILGGHSTDDIAIRCLYPDYVSRSDAIESLPPQSVLMNFVGVPRTCTDVCLADKLKTTCLTITLQTLGVQG